MQVDPKIAENVRSKLRSTLSDAEGIVIDATREVTQKTVHFQQAFRQKCAELSESEPE